MDIKSFAQQNEEEYGKCPTIYVHRTCKYVIKFLLLASIVIMKILRSRKAAILPWLPGITNNILKI
jgi:hypothetical protein